MSMRRSRLRLTGWWLVVVIAGCQPSAGAPVLQTTPRGVPANAPPQRLPGASTSPGTSWSGPLATPTYWPIYEARRATALADARSYPQPPPSVSAAGYRPMPIVVLTDDLRRYEGWFVYVEGRFASGSWAYPACSPRPRVGTPVVDDPGWDIRRTTWRVEDAVRHLLPAEFERPYTSEWEWRRRGVTAGTPIAVTGIITFTYVPDFCNLNVLRRAYYLHVANPQDVRVLSESE